MTAPVLVVGGGVAGASLAVRLAAAGRAVTVIEREASAHHKVCGEFLSYEAQLYLTQLGLDLPSLGAVPIHTVRLMGKAQNTITVTLPFPSLGLSRYVLDEALLSLAASRGAEIVRGRRVVSLTPGWTATLDDETVRAGSAGILATGKHDLRDWQRTPGRQNDLVAFKMHFKLTSAERALLDGHVDLMLFPGGYAGLQPIENDVANLCLVVRRKVFTRLGRTWPTLLDWLKDRVPLLRQRLDGAAARWDKPCAAAGIPYGLIVRATRDGLYRLGDQAAVIPSFSGDGMAIALHSARLAGDFLLRGDMAEAFQKRLGDDLRGQVALATRLSQMLVHRPAQRVFLELARIAPRLVSALATSTRIRPDALRRAGISL